jgi:hypothetical protein
MVYKLYKNSSISNLKALIRRLVIGVAKQEHGSIFISLKIKNTLNKINIFISWQHQKY